MKRILTILLTIVMCISTSSYAYVVSFDGGITGDPTLDNGTYNYKEMLFITGKPIELDGTIKVPDVPENKDSYSLKFDYELFNNDENVSLSRSVTYDVTLDKNEEFNQTVYKAKISKLDESITVGDRSYTLDGYLFSESLLFDNTAAVDYFSGTASGKKYYYINGDRQNNEGKVTININTDTIIGYKHHWGDSEAQIINQNINAQVNNPDYPDSSSNRYLTWDGMINLKISNMNRKDFDYLRNDPQNISFRGNYIETVKKERILQYDYDLPTFNDDGTFDDKDRSFDEKELRQDMLVDSNSLITPKIRDIGGHWAEESIKMMASLQLFDSLLDFGPDLPMTRIEFAKAVSRAMAEIKESTRSDIIKRTRSNPDLLFLDIPNDYKYYDFVEFVKNKGVMIGASEFFMPDDVITRAEVVAIIIRSLGLENLAPSAYYTIGFDDDNQIPNWARDYIYMAKEIGLLDSFADNTFRPHDPVTRAEASQLLKNFVFHIKDDITYDYREKIINNN
jgi:hypothetical protein